MTKIKTAKVKGSINKWGYVNLACGDTSGAPFFVAVEGLTEAEVHEAAALLAKSREVCEIPNLPQDFSTDAGYTYDIYKCGNLSYYTNIRERPNYCPSCGRKVVVK